MRFHLFCLLLSAFVPAAQAAIVEQQMRPAITASAEYVVGERGKPAVLLLHGFLQTREFPTIATLGRGLQSAGFTVLAPTLSLDIPNRTRSLACEAAHRHGMDQDLMEISRWVSWLKARGHDSIVLVGHSFGSLQLLAYLSQNPDPAVKGYVGASLVDAQIGALPRQPLIADMQSRAQNGQRDLVTRSLSFCRNYTSTPESLLSYLQWDPSRVLAALKRSPVDTLLIMGDADERLGRGWLKALRHIQVPMVIVPGASHFMDGTHEFELLELTQRFLEAPERRPAR
ncbi:hypothetical protein Tbd_0996 [Thiobacillus denitrificans ATCC 25259]|uniref:AB hydrolase-1 domain-containing protein n=1 Tax=Thiobacillus denitrificans (strain ATCC 25259 / T1) TaxID=292415 RepID=Q3SK45_THIDA|nr:alpha/beta fold hydrolase [Thiobacillus denitrificans]AAZ96949.1 hypothetical protein Tbd_0996 [Thiobacillus denitrificans ATCC 25259]